MHLQTPAHCLQCTGGCKRLALTRHVGPGTCAHVNGPLHTPLWFEQTDHCWGHWSAVPLTEEVRGKARGWVEKERLPRLPRLPCFPQRARASLPEGLAYAWGPAWLRCLLGLELGVKVPVPPPPSPSWLLEQRHPLSSRSLGNSHQQVPSPGSDGDIVFVSVTG